MKKPFYIVCLLMSVCLYFTFKFTKRGEFAILAVFALILAAVFRVVYDGIHHSFPWSKTTVQKEKDTRDELARREKKLKEQRHKDMKKARKAGKLDEYLEEEAEARAIADAKYEAYRASESETEYVSVKKDVPGAK